MLEAECGRPVLRAGCFTLEAERFRWWIEGPGPGHEAGLFCLLHRGRRVFGGRVFRSMGLLRKVAPAFWALRSPGSADILPRTGNACCIILRAVDLTRLARRSIPLDKSWPFRSLRPHHGHDGLQHRRRVFKTSRTCPQAPQPGAHVGVIGSLGGARLRTARGADLPTTIRRRQRVGTSGRGDAFSPPAGSLDGRPSGLLFALFYVCTFAAPSEGGCGHMHRVEPSGFKGSASPASPPCAPAILRPTGFPRVAAARGSAPLNPARPGALFGLSNNSPFGARTLTTEQEPGRPGKKGFAPNPLDGSRSGHRPHRRKYRGEGHPPKAR